MRPRLATTSLAVPCRLAAGKRRAKFQSALRLLTPFFFTLFFLIFALTVTSVSQQGTKDLSHASLEELSNIQVYSASKHMQSQVQTLAGNTLGGFSVFNVTLLGYTLAKHLDLSSSVYNILDKKYFDPGRPEDSENYIQQDGRNFRIKLTGRF
jgi:TonB dependent receptor